MRPVAALAAVFGVPSDAVAAALAGVFAFAAVFG
jgi:hypothetical protein